VTLSTVQFCTLCTELVISCALYSICIRYSSSFSPESHVQPLDSKRCTFQRSQIVQNAAARIVCQASPRRHHSVDLLKDLLWLPVRGRVDYKIAVLCYKAVKLQQPSYLTGLLSRVLRSSTSDTVNTVFINKHCCLSVLMLRLHRLEQSSFICTHS